MKHDLHSLVGAYALDALPELERHRFEDHLAECETCAQEVRGLRETAARLGSAAAETPPARLRANVLAEVQQVRQLAPLLIDAPAPRARAATWFLGVAAAACLVVAVLLGAATVRTQQRLDRAEAATRELAVVLSAPDARTVKSDSSSAGTGTVVLSRSQGKAVVAMAGLRPLPASKTYELWAMGPDAPRPAGLMRPESGQPLDPVVVSALGNANQVGVTIEPTGGSPRPTNAPVLVVNLPG